MRKISRRIFLLMLLSACAPYPAARQPTPNRLATARGVPNKLTPIGQIPLAHVPSFVPQPTQTPGPLEAAGSSPQLNVVIPASSASCRSAITMPAKPDVIPFPGEIDVSTGRHFMGTMQLIDPASYRLEVSGLVDYPLKLSLDDLFCLPKMTETVTTTCYAFQDTATWSGVLISDVLKMAGVQPGAKKVIQKAADVASRSVTLEMALEPHNFLAYELGGKPLPILFGFPLRSIIIDVAGQYSVKWLTALEVS